MLSFKMTIRPRDRRKVDIDNRIKTVLDALEHAGIMEDDWQVQHLEIKRGEPIAGGLVHITLEVVPDPHESERESPSERQS